MEWKILDFFRPCQPCLFLSRQPQAFKAWKRNQDNEVALCVSARPKDTVR